VLVILNEPKQLEQFILVFQWDPNTGVYHRHFEELLAILVCENFNLRLNLTFLRELQGIGLDPKEHLHNPMLVAADHRTFL